MAPRVFTRFRTARARSAESDLGSVDDVPGDGGAHATLSSAVPSKCIKLCGLNGSYCVGTTVRTLLGYPSFLNFFREYNTFICQRGPEQVSRGLRGLISVVCSSGVWSVDFSVPHIGFFERTVSPAELIQRMGLIGPVFRKCARRSAVSFIHDVLSQIRRRVGIPVGQ